MDEGTKAWLAFLTPIAVAISILLQQWSAWNQRRHSIAAARQLDENTTLTVAVKQDVQKLEEATNGISDKLVDAAKLAALVAVEAKRKMDEEAQKEKERAKAV